MEIQYYAETYYNIYIVNMPILGNNNNNVRCR